MTKVTIGVDPASGKDFTAKFVMVEPEAFALLRRKARAFDIMEERAQWNLTVVRTNRGAPWWSLDCYGTDLLAALEAVELAMKGEKEVGGE